MEETHMNQLYASDGSLFCRFRRTFIGDRTFYKKVLTLIVPLIIQNTISTFVNLLDNIMVGQVGTAEMSGVAIVNQLLFVFNITIFGGLAGAGIYGAQFYGAGDNEGLRSTFRFKLLMSALTLVAGIAIFLTGGGSLISLYLTGDGSAADAAAILGFGQEYLIIMIWGLLPFAMTQVYSSSLRETGETVLPMKASIAAVLTNLCLNYILIFGKLGFPALGAAGAAIATVISRYVELSIIVVYTHRHTIRFPFIKGIYKSFSIPRSLFMRIAKKGMPLLANELLWSLGMTTLMQIFSTSSLSVVAALNISSTTTNLFNVFFITMGTAVAVMAGQALGAGDIARAKSVVWKLIFFSVCVCILMGGILASLSPFIPYIYNTTDSVRQLATHFMITSAIFMIVNATSHCCYFALRSGGKTFITFLFDSVYMWTIGVPFAYVITNFTKLSIYQIYPMSYLTELVKCTFGLLMVRTGIWAQNIVADSVSDPSEKISAGNKHTGDDLAASEAE
jgi:putative MATE family efflux protein